MGLGLQPAIARASFALNNLAVRVVPQRRHLITLTYHRVGNREQLFPEAVDLAECSLEVFEAQMAWLARHCSVLDLTGAMSVIRGERACPNRAVLVTFDDGYREDLLRVEPCLHRHGIRPVVFLPTDYIGTRRRFWWDRIGACVQLTSSRHLRLEIDGIADLPLGSPTERDLAAAQLSHHAKQLSSGERDHFIARIEGVLGLSDTGEADRPLVLSWDEVRALHATFDFGAHTESHPVLGRLSADDARRELQRSRQIVERELGAVCDSVAIPYGGAEHYTRETVQIAAELGYSVVFSLEETLRGAQRHGDMYLVDRVALSARGGLPVMVLKLTWPDLFVPSWTGRVHKLLNGLRAV